jgi:hypothetical protein
MTSVLLLLLLAVVVGSSKAAKLRTETLEPG